MQKIELIDLLKSGVHFGHRASKWHPNMRPFIYGEKGGIHIIDLEQTRIQLEKAYKLVYESVADGNLVLFVGTKRQIQPIITEIAKDAGMPFVTERWIGGLLTNFGVVSKMAKKLSRLKKQKEIGEWSKYTKKEALMLEREMIKLDRNLGGVEGMDRVPGIVFITDMKHESTALREAIRKGLIVITIADTNTNPEQATLAIPGNDDAVKSVTYITKVIGQAAKEGRVIATKRAEELRVAAAAAKEEEKKKRIAIKKMKPVKPAGQKESKTQKPKPEGKKAPAAKPAAKIAEKKPAAKPEVKKEETK